MERPKITVIIPAYNIENLITRCVESVVKQTYPEELIQILVVDDGSTDNTGRIIDELADKYSNVTALHEPNGGSSRARNYALSKAEGDYIGFVDSDDYISPFMYEKLVDALIRNNALMAQTGRDEIAEDGSRLPDVVQVPEWETIYTDKGFLKELLMHRGDASFCTKLTSRKLFDIDEALISKHKNGRKYDFNWTNYDEYFSDLKGTFDFIVIDPPFITEEAWSKFAAFGKYLANEKCKFLVSSIAENAENLKKFLGVDMKEFKPSIPHLVYQYNFFANYDDEELNKKNPEIIE